MNFPKATPLSLAAMTAAAVVFTACSESPTSPRPVTSAEARADLEAMAAKVKYFAPQSPGADMDMGGGAKRGAAKMGAVQNQGSACDLEATEISTWNSDTTAGGDGSLQYDTTVFYTSADQPICNIDDVKAYQISSSHSENAMLETYMKRRTDFPADLRAGEYRMTGSGTVRYKGGYLITITSMNMVMDMGQGIMKTYLMNLTLEKGYTVALGVAPGIDLMSENEPSQEKVMVSGPISKDGVVVGYFEVLGDDRVVIRDADKAIIESHG